MTDSTAAPVNADVAAAPGPVLGAIGWADLTVPDAGKLKEFYSAVVGWAPTGLSMGAYEDYLMQAPGAPAAQAGVCHARGQNAAIPPVWLIYISVANLDASLAECTARGGSVVMGPAGAGGTSRFAVIRDPAGAVAALHQA